MMAHEAVAVCAHDPMAAFTHCPDLGEPRSGGDVIFRSSLLAGTVRAWFAWSRRRLELIGGIGGLAMIGLGLSIAATKSSN